MEASDSSSDNGSVETVEDSASDKENEDAGENEASKGCASREILGSNVCEGSKECDAGSDFSALELIRSADQLLAGKTVDNSQLEPEVGMVFHSEEQAYAFYNTYAKRRGFSVRKGHLGRRKDGSIRDRVYLCSYEGTRQKHCTHNTRKPRPVVRTNCMARIEYKVTRENIWVVNKVIHEHNHPLIRPSKAYLLRSHRKMLAGQQAGADEMAGDGPRPAEVQDFPAEQVHETEIAGFLLRDQSSYLHTNRMRELEKGDAQILLDFLSSKQLEDPSFFYAIQLDDKEQVTNIFWADPRSIIDYAYFGDVVLFDTTYHASKNDLPIALFIGINHHKQAIVFGAALLLDETTESFAWLFRTFLTAMSGHQPKTIFTDHCTAMSRAISMTLPGTCHRICLWHILQNAAKNISHLYSSESTFQKDFKNCIFEAGSEEDFHTGWVNLLGKYDLAGSSYLEDLYATREKWALVYGADIFCASMTTVEWSESMKKHFKKHFNRKLPLSKFIEQYHNALIQFRQKELYEDYRSRQTKPVVLFETPMLNEAAESYTRLMYKDFEDQYRGQLSCLCQPVALDGTTLTFKVSLPEKHYYGLVEFNPSNYTITCSCKKFESIGILCMHALKVLNNNNILHLPSQYIIKRWTKYANDGVVSNRHQSVVEAYGQEHLTSLYSRVCHKAITIAAKSSFSKDALDIFEHQIDRLMEDVENLLHRLTKQIEDVDIVDGLQEDTPESSKKKRGRKSHLKGSFEGKRNRKAQTSGNSSETAIPHHPSQRQINNASAQVIIEESSHIPTYHGDGSAAFCNPVTLQSSGVPGCTSFPLETVMPAQESFAPSQGLFDHALASQGANSPNIAWCSSRGSVSVPMPVMPGQTNNFLSWVVPPNNVSNISIAQRHLDQPLHSTVPNQHQSLPRKLNFDINKGN